MIAFKINVILNKYNHALKFVSRNFLKIFKTHFLY